MPTRTKFAVGGTIIAEDAEGKRHRILVTIERRGLRSTREGRRKTVKTSTKLIFKLPSGGSVERIAGDTFEIVETGKLLNRVVECQRSKT